MRRAKVLYTREEMYELNVKKLESRGVSIDDIAEIAYRQQSRFTPDVSMREIVESVQKILSYRDIFHMVQLGCEIDRLVEEKAFQGPIQDIILEDLGLFGVDELFGLEIAGIFGTVGKTNYGEIDVNRPLKIRELNEMRNIKRGTCHTFLDDIVGAIAAGASTRVSQMTNENRANKDPNVEEITLDI